MKYPWIFLFMVLWSAGPALALEQVCSGSDCVQIAKNYGTINVEGRKLQIVINNGVVNIIGNPADKSSIKNYAIKVANLEAQVTRHLATIDQNENRRLSDQEKLHKSVSYVESLLKQIDQLGRRIAKLDEQHELTGRIKAAKDIYDVPLIKRLLKEKQRLDDKQAAETAFELAGFQEIDLEYTDAYNNYKQAVFLQNDSGTYLNAAGLMALTLGEFDNSIDYFEKALASDLNTFGEDHPRVATYRNNLGSAW